MKLKLILLALVALGMGACTQRTCPTYAMEDAEKDTKEINVTAEAYA